MTTIDKDSAHVTQIPYTPLTKEEEAIVLEAILETSPVKYAKADYKTSFYMGINSTPKPSWRHTMGRACHADFASMRGDDLLGIFNFWPHFEEKLSHEVSAALTRFIKYIYDEAPCSYFIPFKKNNDVRSKGFFMPASLNKSFVHFFNIIGRTIHERPEELVKWHKLVEAGVNPDIAMFLIKNLYEGTTGIVSLKGYSHDSPFLGDNKSGCRNYHDHAVLNLGFLSDASYNCKNSASYRGTSKIFKSPSCAENLSEQINEEVAAMHKPVEAVEQARLDNPFTKAQDVYRILCINGGRSSVEAIGLKWTEEFK